MKTLLGLIVFFVLFGWLGLAAVLVLVVKYFWVLVALLAIWVFRGPLGELSDRLQGVPPAVVPHDPDAPVCPACGGYGGFYTCPKCTNGKAGS